MNKPKVAAEEYIQFLVASPAAVSGTEAARVHAGPVVAHDAYTRLLHRLEPDAATLWQEAQGLVQPLTGVLVLDDTTLDKPYAQQMGLVTRHWSGKHHAVVQGINLLTLLWSDGQALVPVDYRLYDKVTDHLTKNDHFQHLLQGAQQRGFAPQWYSSTAGTPAWPTSSRCAPWAGPGSHASSATAWSTPTGRPSSPWPTAPSAPTGNRLAQGYGPLRVFRLATPDGGTEGAEYWASSQTQLGEADRAPLAALSWGIEQYHRGLKQCCGVEKAHVRAARAQRNHIGCALRAFLRLETQRLQTGRSWYEAKKQLLREAIRTYLANPIYLLHAATA